LYSLALPVREIFPVFARAPPLLSERGGAATGEMLTRDRRNERGRGDDMKPANFRIVLALVGAFWVTDAVAECQIADAKLEEAIAQKPELRDHAHRQTVRDLRRLRDAAFTLWSYGRHDDCERLLANIRELVAGPSMSTLGDNDEEEAEKQIAAREPKARRGKSLGSRSELGAKPLVKIIDLAPALRADEIMGAEVRTSDDKIVGEVRNIVFGTKDRQNYAVVASGGFFTRGNDSVVVPIRLLLVSQERNSFFLPIDEKKLRAVPLMPDHEYKWVTDVAWRTQNDAHFVSR
jgi:hypothetical protein